MTGATGADPVDTKMEDAAADPSSAAAAAEVKQEGDQPMEEGAAGGIPRTELAPGLQISRVIKVGYGGGGWMPAWGVGG